jgi:hypothetical protein
VIKLKALVSFLLLFVFGVLFLKNLLPNHFKHAHHNCDELAHIHIYHLAHETDFQKIQETSESSEASNECHSGNTGFGFFILEINASDFIKETFYSNHQIISSIDAYHDDPNLEPHRKPPRPG